MTQLPDILWLCLAAYAIHVLEEFAFDWRNWARNVLSLPVEWAHFYITNALVVVLGIVAPMIAPIWPTLALGFPALMLINATFFHVLPFVEKRGRFSPGLITALVLFYPLGLWAFDTARPTLVQLFEALGIGALLMATPIVFLKLRLKPYFDQNR